MPVVADNRRLPLCCERPVWAVINPDVAVIGLTGRVGTPPRSMATLSVIGLAKRSLKIPFILCKTLTCSGGVIEQLGGSCTSEYRQSKHSP